ncbi:MAG: hypothetical protein LBH98_06540 [Chitinispirillales bacterium]|jgi:hypothetical protein|nr:hypothetical protein [Chitinispirillales bacterium]
MKLKTFAMFLCVTSIVFSKDFLSKEFIDTTIQGAYYGFVAANKEAGGSTQTSAIQKAKGVVSELKKLAENDPNKRYILWRLSELEAQIGLEEEEVMLKQRYATVKKINELVDLFNKEVLQPRPNFANLYTLYQRMSAVDVSKTNEFAEIINQKNRSVSFNLKQSITNAFADNDYTRADNDYDYATENRKYLNISNYEIESWRKNIQAKRDADYLKAGIDNQIAFVNGIVLQNRLSEARRHIEVLNNNLTGASVLLTQSFISSTKMKINNLSANIDRREDSLIQYGYSLVNGQKYKEASIFLRETLFPSGADRNRTAAIDRAIIESSGGKINTYESNLEFENFSEESVTAMNEAMKQKIKTKTDSIRSANEADDIKAQAHFEKKNKNFINKYVSTHMKQKKIQYQCDDFLAEISKMFAQGKGAAAVKKFKSKKDLCFANATPKNYYDVKVLVNNQTNIKNDADSELIAMMKKHKENSTEGKREKSIQITKEINDMIAKNNATQAYLLFYFNRSLLDEFFPYEKLSSIRRALVKSYIKETGI